MIKRIYTKIKSVFKKYIDISSKNFKLDVK